MSSSDNDSAAMDAAPAESPSTDAAAAAAAPTEGSEQLLTADDALRQLVEAKRQLEAAKAELASARPIVEERRAEQARKRSEYEAGLEQIATESLKTMEQVAHKRPRNADVMTRKFADTLKDLSPEKLETLGTVLQIAQCASKATSEDAERRLQEKEAELKKAREELNRTRMRLQDEIMSSGHGSSNRMDTDTATTTTTTTQASASASHRVRPQFGDIAGESWWEDVPAAAPPPPMDTETTGVTTQASHSHHNGGFNVDNCFTAQQLIGEARKSMKRWPTQDEMITCLQEQAPAALFHTVRASRQCASSAFEGVPDGNLQAMSRRLNTIANRQRDLGVRDRDGRPVMEVEVTRASKAFSMSAVSPGFDDLLAAEIAEAMRDPRAAMERIANYIMSPDNRCMAEAAKSDGFLRQSMMSH